MNSRLVNYKKLIVLFVAGLLFWLSYFSQYTILSPYIREIGTLTQLGIVMSCLTVGTLMFRPWLGRVADKNSRQSVMFIGLLAVAIAPIGYWIAPFIPTLMFFRGLSGVGLAAIRTSYLPWVIDFAPFIHQSKIVSCMSLSQSIGTFIGPLICSWIWHYGGYSCGWLLMSGLAVLGMFAVLSVSDSVVLQKESTLSISTQEIDNLYWKRLREPAFSVPTLIMLIIGFMGAAVPSFLPLLVPSVALHWNIGWFFGASAIASITIRVIISLYLDRFERGVFITTGLLCYTFGMLILSTAKNGQQITLAMLFTGTGFGMLIPAITALVVDRCEPFERSRLYSLVTMGMDIGLGIGPLLLGLIADYYNLQFVFAICVVFGFVGLTTFAMYSNKTVSRSLYFSLGKVKDDYSK